MEAIESYGRTIPSDLYGRRLGDNTTQDTALVYAVIHHAIRMNDRHWVVALDRAR